MIENSNFIEKTKSIESIQDDCNCNNDYIDPFFPGERPEISDFDYVTPEITINKNLPNSFSWKDYEGEDFTTPANDQLHPLPCGICFIHAAVGALEGVIKIKEGCANLNSDLSIQYVISCLSNFNCITGGFGYWIYEYINDTSGKGNFCNGIIPEFCFPFVGVDRNGNSWFESGYPPVLCEDKIQNWEDFLIPITDYQFIPLRNFEEDEYMDIIKTLIMEKGSLNAGIAHSWDWHKWGWANNEPDDYYPYPGPCETAINHEIVLLGWKDDTSIENGGYWICKNSYGTEWGYDGFFNIEYGTNYLCSYYGDVAWVGYDPNSYNNWIPTIILDESYYGNTGEIITFNAGDSIDHEGEIFSYEWDFGDETLGTGSNPTHAYSEQGVYQVNLIVTDDSNNIVNDTTWAFIDRTNSAPEAPTIIGETNGKNETLYNYSFLASDPDGDDVYYYVFWGGFRWEDWYGPFTSEEEIIKSHMWGINETFIIYAKAKDVYGAESDWATLEVKITTSKSINTPFLQ
ncbi:MAG: PKD domain-containing protein, partial [Thermoplasmatales archaeon]|nr:PKD domain-containing protein [Thermoplasmatales archaeon]